MLRTPVQYESVLDELNTVRPLQLADEGKVALDTPVLNANPVSSSRPAIGKLLRCNQRGGILRSPVDKYTSAGYLEYTYIYPINIHRFTFSEVTPVVFVECIDPVNVISYAWTDSTGDIAIVTWPVMMDRLLRFYGKRLWIKVVFMVGGSVTIRAHYLAK